MDANQNTRPSSVVAHLATEAYARTARAVTRAVRRRLRPRPWANVEEALRAYRAAQLTVRDELGTAERGLPYVERLLYGAMKEATVRARRWGDSIPPEGESPGPAEEALWAAVDALEPQLAPRTYVRFCDAICGLLMQVAEAALDGRRPAMASAAGLG